jgi:hypothetical protein
MVGVLHLLEALTPAAFVPRDKGRDLLTLPLEVGLSLLRYATVAVAFVSPFLLWGRLRRWWDWPSWAEIPVTAGVCVLAVVAGLALAWLVTKVQVAVALRLYPNDPGRRRGMLASASRYRA